MTGTKLMFEMRFSRKTVTGSLSPEDSYLNSGSSNLIKSIVEIVSVSDYPLYDEKMRSWVVEFYLDDIVSGTHPNHTGYLMGELCTNTAKLLRKIRKLYLADLKTRGPE